ncbi:hypothetical protein [Psychrobacter sp. FDAARGOS_221]|uniref:hypothetical protein n=1 Tax=Psychrobacter sp. FDAARGOS_221 TaxID=1975705 RepID=UPI000BB53AC3|nr:hypothetical protein [Psychrobacter sp. FDAARGOS_221]PNK59869.1 hypothetical protein A6J60_002555 [Psychrobacter sp. FDAARGOS_221]
MKPLITSIALLTTLALSGCATTGGTTNGNTTMGNATNMGMNIFKSAVDAQCRSELEKQNAWRVARVAMNTEQEEAAKTKICGCVSEQAPQQVTVVELAEAAMDTTYRSQLVTKVVAKSLQSCYASFTKPSA